METQLPEAAELPPLPAAAMPSSTEAERRQTVIRVMTDLFIHDDGNLTDKERATHEEVLTSMVREAGITMRQEVAERFCNLRYAPKQVVQDLARDDITVSKVLLSHSPALSDRDLTTIAHEATLEHRLAIAGRVRVSSPLVTALVISGEDEVFETLAHNPGAKIDDAALARLAARSQNNARLAEALMMRDDLEAGALSKLFWTASASMREKIISLVRPERIQTGRLSHAPIRVGSEADQQAALTGLAAVLTAGRRDDFRRIASQLLGVSEALMGRMMSDTEGTPFALACKAAGFPHESFTTLLLLFNPAVSQSVKRVFALTELFERIEPRTAWYFLETWHQDRNLNVAEPELALKPAIHETVPQRAVSSHRWDFEKRVAEQATNIAAQPAPAQTGTEERRSA